MLGIKLKEKLLEIYFYFFCGLIILIIGLIYYFNELMKKALLKAKNDYLDSLKELKRTPTNADHREQTLAFGRIYSNLTRNNAGVTTVDEISLMNDINAACAAATSNLHLESTPLSAGASIETRLRTLTDLRDKELVDATEYEKRRCEILNSI